MARRVLIGGRRRRVLARLSPWLLLAGLALVGCKPEGVPNDAAPGPSSSTDGASEAVQAGRLERALAPWPDRWKRESPPPECAELLNPPERAVCATAEEALAVVQRASARSPADLLKPVTDLALAAHRTTGALRLAGFSELLANREERDRDPHGKPDTISDTDASPRVPAADTDPRRPDADLEIARARRKHQNPTLSAIVAYSRLASLALRQLAVYLEFGPKSLRRRTLNGLSRLAAEEPRWRELVALVRQAALLEHDPELRKDLEKLQGQLRGD